MTEQKYEVPETISFTPRDREQRWPILKEGNLRTRVTRVSRGVNNDSANLYLELQLAPVRMDGSVGSPTVKRQLTVPLPNPDPKAVGRDGKPHTAPNTFGFCQEWLLAADPDNFQYFAKKKTDTVYVTAAGEEISKSAAYELNNMLRDKVFDEMERRWADPDIFLDEEVYIQVAHKAGTEGKVFAEVKKIYTEEPDELTTDNFGIIL